MSVLIFDADDTLWENNIYFEHAFDDFVEFLAHSSLTPPQVRDVLNEIELVNSKIHGYGSRNFGRNLQQAYQHLAEREIRPDDLGHVMSLAERILEQPIELIEGVDFDAFAVAQQHGLAEVFVGQAANAEDQHIVQRRLGILGEYYAASSERTRVAARGLPGRIF